MKVLQTVTFHCFMCIKTLSSGHFSHNWFNKHFTSRKHSFSKKRNHFLFSFFHHSIKNNSPSKAPLTTTVHRHSAAYEHREAENSHHSHTAKRTEPRATFDWCWALLHSARTSQCALMLPRCSYTHTHTHARACRVLMMFCGGTIRMRGYYYSRICSSEPAKGLPFSPAQV